MHILIVEDEKLLSGEIRKYLEREGFSCEEAFTGRVASDKLWANEYDIVLLDLGLPDYDGIDLLREMIKAKKDSAIIILSARSSLDEKIRGLNLGADDYLPKPFSLLELKSRILAVVRRKHGLKGNLIRINDLEIDLDKRMVFCMGQPLPLTRKEYDILVFLVLNKDRVVTRLQISEHIWGDIIEENYNSNYIDVHIKNLRKKIGDLAGEDYLETVRGVGFRFNTVDF
ncbi:MAG: response regulator transcription factor [Bacteroidia bacterium]|nr:response regulator transcription factor [Bacteroidia bacterium]